MVRPAPLDYEPPCSSSTPPEHDDPPQSTEVSGRFWVGIVFGMFIVTVLWVVAWSLYVAVRS